MRILVCAIVLLCCGCSHYWKVEREWLVSPSGGKCFMFAITTVPENDMAKVNAYGFNACGSWSGRTNLPYTKVIGLSYVGEPGTPEWEQNVEAHIVKAVVPNDRNLIGYYLDNEIILKSPAAYFRTANRLLKKYDPNHLNLGIRFNHPPSDDVLIASKGLVDAHSFNIYADEPEKWDAQFERVWRLAGVRSIVSEFSFYADENTSGNLNRRGFGGRVKTQQGRADAFEKSVTAWASNPLVIGVEFFQLYDEPPQGRFDGEDCNYGVLDMKGMPYPLAFKAKELGPQLDRIRRNAVQLQN